MSQAMSGSGAAFDHRADQWSDRNACLNAPLRQLPGDPGLLLFTNVDMGDKKMAFMKAASAAMAKSLGKPESFVAVAVMARFVLRHCCQGICPVVSWP
jgi:Macrophage migration inhibitory factor (MIF)